MGKKIKLSICIVAFLAAFGIGGFIWLGSLFTPFSYVALNEIRWDQPPGLVAIKDMERDGHADGTLFVRLKDGKEQFAYEGWEVLFSDYGSAFAFQKEFIPPADTAHVLYYIEDGERVTKLTIENSGGYIKDIQENPGRTYVFVEFVVNESSSFCMLERVASSALNANERKCLQLEVPHASQGIWNPRAERELVVATQSNRIFTVDPWEKRPRQIYADGDTKPVYDKLRALFDKKSSDPASYEGPPAKKFVLLPFVTVILDKKIRLLPSLNDTKLAWIDDSHLLAKKEHSLEIIEYKTGSVAGLLYEQSMYNKPVLIHTQGNDIELY
ncbi:hypothetical protein HYV71_04650 [Candidatus Uhrbacteria bacterium]|nr:hypothetical protein [Candidatus Uhrbacteria bacterium]